MSETRPLADTLPQAEGASCPLFPPGSAVRSRSWRARRARLLSATGVSLVALMLLEAVYRLGVRALLTVREGLTLAQWCVLFLSILGFAYGEGYRALHRRFAPHVIARAVELANTENAGLRSWLSSPLYVLCLVRAEPAELRRAWVSVALIASAVLIVRRLPEPYRGMIDAGVAVALCIGLGSLLIRFASVVRNDTRG